MEKQEERTILSGGLQYGQGEKRSVKSRKLAETNSFGAEQAELHS